MLQGTCTYCVTSSAIAPGRDIVRGETHNRHPFSIDTPRLLSIMLDVHLFIQPQHVPHREHSGSITKTDHSDISRTLMLLLLLLLLLLLTALELSLGSSSPYTSTDKTNKNKYT